MTVLAKKFSHIKVDEKGRDHLVIPDDHASPFDTFDRYEWLGQFILEKQPEVIVKIGDSWDMPSLSSYDKGKKSHTVTKNVKADIESGHYSEQLLFGPIIQYNNTMTKWKKRKYNPLIVKCIGNHEFRLKRMLEYEPQWEGTVDMGIFRTRLDLDEVVVPYLDYDIFDGVGYSHYFVSGVQGRPASSAAAMIRKTGISCTMGHVHTLDYATQKRADGKLTRGVFCGSFHDKNHESFAGKQVDNVWWNGVIYKHNVIEGDYDIEEWSVERLEREYS